MLKTIYTIMQNIYQNTLPFNLKLFVKIIKIFRNHSIQKIYVISY